MAMSFELVPPSSAAPGFLVRRGDATSLLRAPVLGVVAAGMAGELTRPGAAFAIAADAGARPRGWMLARVAAATARRH